MRIPSTVSVLTIGLILLLAAPAPAQNTKCDWAAMTAGYAAPSGGNLQLRSVAGQIVGMTGSATSRIQSGFLVHGFLAGQPVAVPDGEEIPRTFALSQNYPNPFNPTTTILVDLPREEQVRVVVYNLVGQEVGVLLDERRVAGRYRVQFDAAHLASGVYFCRMHAGEFIATRKLMLVK